MIKPELLCMQHLLGEHFEIHKAVGNLKHSGTWTISLTKKGFLEPHNFLKRHNQLVLEMKKRGMNHQSSLDIRGIKFPKGKVDIKKSLFDLKKRCKKCREKMQGKFISKQEKTRSNSALPSRLSGCTLSRVLYAPVWSAR